MAKIETGKGDARAYGFSIGFISASCILSYNYFRPLPGIFFGLVGGLLVLHEVRKYLKGGDL